MAASSSLSPTPVAGTRFRLARVAETGSTNADLLAAASGGELPGLVLVADHQTAGRGRRTRHWTSAPGASLLVSILLEPVAADDAMHQVGAVALALLDALHAVANVRALVKWPNDLVVDDRKLAGVLAESAYRGSAPIALVVGAGCNLRAGAIDPVDRATATSVEEVVGSACDRDALLDAMLRRLDAWLAVPDQVHAELTARSATLGRRVVVETDAVTLTGVADALFDDGALGLAGDDGQTYEIRVGDVVHLRHREAL